MWSETREGHWGPTLEPDPDTGKEHVDVTDVTLDPVIFMENLFKNMYFPNINTQKTSPVTQ